MSYTKPGAVKETGAEAGAVLAGHEDVNSGLLIRVKRPQPARGGYVDGDFELIRAGGHYYSYFVGFEGSTVSAKQLTDTIKDKLREIGQHKSRLTIFERGMLRLADDTVANEWPSESLDATLDGKVTSQLQESAAKTNVEGQFDPAILEDERERKLREIIQRRGQPEFRSKLIDSYNSRCAITQCDAVAALEAAHIMPYLGPESNDVSNGLLLRADIHTLFDLGLIGIDPESMTVALAEQLEETCYEIIDGEELHVPDNPETAPSKKALQQRWDAFTAK